MQKEKENEKVNIDCPNMFLFGRTLIWVPEREKGAQKIVCGSDGHKFSTFEGKKINKPQVKINLKKNLKKTTLKPIIIKLLKTSGKEKY